MTLKGWRIGYAPTVTGALRARAALAWGIAPRPFAATFCRLEPHAKRLLRHKPSHLGIILALAAFASAQTTQTTPRISIRVINAQTNKPVTDERLNVSLHADRIGFTIMPTDKDGAIAITPGNASIIHVLSNFYADCRPRAELYTNYSLDTVRGTGITAGNLCSGVHPAPKPGQLLLFVIPKNAIRKYGQPPASNLPHSDENPNAVPDNPQPVPR